MEKSIIFNKKREYKEVSIKIRGPGHCCVVICDGKDTRGVKKSIDSVKPSYPSGTAWLQTINTVDVGELKLSVFVDSCSRVELLFSVNLGHKLVWIRKSMLCEVAMQYNIA